MTTTISFDQPTNPVDLQEAFTLAARLRSEGFSVSLTANHNELSILTDATPKQATFVARSLGIREA